MGRSTNYRQKMLEKLDSSPEHSVKIQAETMIRVLDALEAAGINEGPDFCNRVAETTGYSRNAISDMFSGKASVSRHFIEIFSNVFNVNEDYLLEGKGSIFSASTPETSMRSADEILDELRMIKGCSSDKELGKCFGVQQSTVASWRQRDSLPYKEILKICHQDNIPLESLFFKPGLNKIAEEDQICEKEFFANPMVANLQPIIKTIAEAYEAQKTIVNLSTGFDDLDSVSGGLRGGELVVIASRPSIGKTTLALNIAQHVAGPSESSRPVAFFSLKLQKEQVLFRLLSSASRVQLRNLENGHLVDGDWDRIMRGADKLWESSFLIEDSPVSTAVDVCETSRTLHATHGIGLVVVDTLQMLCQGCETPEQQWLMLTNSCYELKRLARELNVPVIITSALNSSNAKQVDIPPSLSNLTSIAGNAADIADLILFLHPNEDFYDVSDLIVCKNSSGPVGVARLNAELEHFRFQNVDG